MMMLVAAVVMIPPAMSKRPISPAADPYPGEKIAMQVGADKFTAYIPAGWKPSQRIAVAVHFHGPDWHSIQEHIASGEKSVLLSSSPGEGSSTYAKLMGTKGTLDAWFVALLSELKKRGAEPGAQVTDLDLSSFSAGYGAIRELVQQPEVYRRIRSVILCDSMYGSLAPGDPRRPLDAHIEVWIPLARDAMAGRKTFVASVSSVPTPSYASSSECLTALVEKIGLRWNDSDPAWPATKNRDYPLIRWAGKGGFFAWHYAGHDAAAHTTHIRHLADIRLAIREKK